MFARRDSHGVIHPWLIILVVVVIAAIGFAAWKVSSNKNSPKSSSTTASSNQTAGNAISTADCLKVINDNDLCKFAVKYNPKASFVATDNATTSQGSSVMTLKVSGNDSSISISQNGSETSSFVSLNNATYIKDESTNVWTKYTSSSTTPTESNPTGNIKFSSSDLTDNNTLSYKAMGKEACGNLTCFKYQVVDKSNPSDTQYLWFDTKDYMMRRWSLKNSDGTNDLTFSYQSVNIAAPSPSQDYSPPSVNY